MSVAESANLASAAKAALTGIEGKELTNKDRMALPVQDMPCQEPAVRAHNMDEVAIGYTEAQARVEASRCLQCKNAPCVSGCPVSIDIPGFIKLVAQGEYHGAADVRREGHEVVIFEAFQKPGGVMVYGIPEFRLPKAIVREEADKLERMGVRFELNTLVGRTRPLAALLQEDGFDAAFVGVGAGLPKFMDIPGENFVGVFSANEYLTRANLMRAWAKDRADTPIYPSKRVAVLGGGNVAMDSARMAMRLGAEEVHILYRRTREEMPARAEEVGHAMEEGVVFDFLASPTEVLSDGKGVVSGLRVMSYRLGDPDPSGRRSPVAIGGSEHDVPFDTVIVAVGNESNPLLAKTTPGLAVDKKGHVLVDERQKTALDGVWAGGDIVLGAATVILAMGEGRRAAASINEYLATGH